MKSPALGEKEIEKNNSKSTCCRHLPTCNHLLFYFFSYTLLSVENRALNEKKNNLANDEKREVELESQLSGLPVETNGDLCIFFTISRLVCNGMRITCSNT